MKRTIIILCALLAACDVGDATSGNNPGTDGGTMSDGGGGGGGDASGANCTNGETAGNVSPAHPHAAPVNAADPYNMGQNCLQANCHGTPQGNGATQYYAGGTVYTDATGTTGAAGAYVRFGNLHTYADDHGNFYLTTQPMFPVASNETLVDATCPTQSKMVEATATGQCTSSACHGAGTTGGYVHL